MRTSKTLTIFEGCDGSGKTTAALHYAKQIDAQYVHFNNLPRVRHGLARMYVEAMLPALLGYQDVVFDRSWFSETPYGEAFREGQDRLTQADRRMLERLALRCGAVMVLCDPGFDVANTNFSARKGKEYLKTSEQLHQVYDAYLTQRCELPMSTFDYTKERVVDVWRWQDDRHPLGLASAGNWGADYILVGERFAERKDQDPWYQWPFASFSNEGCSQWLTNQLHDNGVPERNLLWVNADQNLDFLHSKTDATIIALGTAAAAELYQHKIKAITVDHPQHHKRFKAGQRYPLLDIIT